MRKVKLQIFFIFIALFNFCYKVFFLFTLRKLLLKLIGVKIGKKSQIAAVKFFSIGKLSVGENTSINNGCYLDNRRGIYIGNNVIIAHDSKLYTLGHEINDASFKTKGAPITIEDYVIVFSNALIMPGVTIKKGAVVLPGSVVTKDVEEMTIVGGNPAKEVKKRTILHNERKSYKYWFSL